MDLINWQDFEKVELRTGTILEVHEFLGADKAALKIKIDFGNCGIKWSSAQITKHYNTIDLVGKQIVAVLNFPKKQIANFMSECLVTGFADENGDIVLTTVDKQVPDGSKLM